MKLENTLNHAESISRFPACAPILVTQLVQIFFISAQMGGIVRDGTTLSVLDL